MKTYNEIKDLNYNDVAFFKGISVSDAKYIVAESILQKGEELKFTKTGVVCSINETIDKSKVDFTMKSNSNLEGKNQMEYLCDYYNKGVPLSKLKEYSEEKSFVKALSFSGKESIVNEILNTEQLEKVRRTWLLKNTLYKNHWSKNTILFIENNAWANEFLNQNGVGIEKISSEIKIYNESKNKNK